MGTHGQVLVITVVLLLAWLLIPAVAAWLTFRITPDQRLQANGPFKGLSLKLSGAFAAYFIVLLLISTFVYRVGMRIIGNYTLGGTWTVEGSVALYDANGKALAGAPVNLDRTFVRILPDVNVVSQKRMTLRLALGDGAVPDIYLEVPAWGGTRISLDSASIVRDHLSRTIRLKNVVSLQQQSAIASTVGATER